MNPTIFFSICSLFYCGLLLYMLFSKTEKKTVENKILKILTTINLFSLLCEGAGMFLGNNYERFKLLNDVSLRLMLALYIAWFSVFVLYVLNIAKNYKKLRIPVRKNGIKIKPNKIGTVATRACNDKRRD